MELAWVIFLFVSLAGVGNAHGQRQCYECLTLVQGQEYVALLNLSASDVRRALSSDILDDPLSGVVPGECEGANYGETTNCAAGSTGCATESFTLNLTHSLTGNFEVGAMRRYCTKKQQGCLRGPDYLENSIFKDSRTLNGALKYLNSALTYVGLVEGSVCTCRGSLCNGATGRETSYVVLLAGLLLTVSAKYVY